MRVVEYDRLEKEGKKELSCRFLEAFCPEFYENLGFPVRIQKDDELWKYVDSQHDGRVGVYYGYGWAPTYDEVELIKELVVDVYNWAKNMYGKEILVKSPILSSNYALRCINILDSIVQGGGDKPTIMELGAGSGMLGAMLVKSGYKYIATDVTQAFYLEQNALWNGLFPEKVYEYVDVKENANTIKENKIVHIPYWKLWQMRNNTLDVDIMMGNHNLAEMHPYALRFYLQWGKQLMRNSKYKLFVAQSFGALTRRTMEDVFMTFREMGYELLYSSDWFTIFCVGDKEGIVPVPHLSISGLFKECYGGNERSPRCNNEQDKLARKFESERQRYWKMDKVEQGELEQFFHSVSEQYDSPDEEFMHYCGYYGWHHS